MRITVIGTGYVGTVTGACLSYLGHHVTCVDSDSSKIEKLQRGESPIYEPYLESAGCSLLSGFSTRRRFCNFCNYFLHLQIEKRGPSGPAELEVAVAPSTILR